MSLSRIRLSCLLFLCAALFAEATLDARGKENVSQSKSLVEYVNPFVGTSNFGTTNPGVLCPNGMMSVSPFNVMGSELNKYDKDERWWSTPYTSENVFLTGFSHINLSGVGCPELGIALSMPTSGELEVDYHLYGSEYINEQAEPGYYSCELLQSGIKAELSSTCRTSVERYSYHQGRGNILVNFGQGLTNETGAWLRKISDTQVEGMRFAGSFCYNSQAVFPVYFAFRINKRPQENGFWKMMPKMHGVEAEWTEDDGSYKVYKKYGREIAGDDIGYWFSFPTEEGEQVELQMAISFVSCANAWENLEAELGENYLGESKFDEVRESNKAEWERELSRITVSGGSEQDKGLFYTALYHCLIHPSIINDVNGQYPLMESEGVGRVEEGHNRYSVFSLWDTYRNLHQLLSLAYPHKQADMLLSMLGIYEEWGWMPKWELFGRETFTMEGDPSISVFVDSYLKGIRGFDIDKVYEAFVKSATTPGDKNLMRPDIDPYLSKGYIPLGFYSSDASGDNSVSHALEYYIADYALSLLASKLGKKEDAARFLERSLRYKAYYCPEYGCLRPINKDGSFLSPFNPRQGENFEPVPGFHEGSAWNYTFYIPHDVYGLAKLMGGNKAFVDKLQKVFDEGLYDPANEPDIAYPYLFSYFKGEEWRTQKIVSKLIDDHYTLHPSGIPGNDDTGTMSAWLVFSMMGIYPDCPGHPSYTLTTPRFKRVDIALNPDICEGNGMLSISKLGGGKRIKRVALGKTKKRAYRIEHRELVETGSLSIYTD